MLGCGCVCVCVCVCACVCVCVCGGGEGAGGRGLNFPLPIPFNPGSRPVHVGSCLFTFFRLQSIAQCCIIFPNFFHFPPPWESHFLPPLLPSPVPSSPTSHLPPPFLLVTRPLSPSTCVGEGSFLNGCGEGVWVCKVGGKNRVGLEVLIIRQQSVLKEPLQIHFNFF